MANRIRKIQLHFMVDEQERKIIDAKMELIGTNNLGAYLRRMAIYGYMIELDMEPLNRLTVELSTTLISLPKEPTKLVIFILMILRS